MTLPRGGKARADVFIVHPALLGSAVYEVHALY